MGWFWADPVPDNDEFKQMLCPSKPEADRSITGSLWAPNADIWGENAQHRISLSEQLPKCPVNHTEFNWPRSGKPNSKPSNTQATTTIATGAAKPTENPENKPSQCPVNHAQLNKFNNMPVLSSSRLPGQTSSLPTERTVSSIPRGEESQEGFWEYPSPQQMLNAMVRKSGREGIPEDAVESMVDVHNFLNEGVWNEVQQWERPYTEQSSVTPRLLKFQGRPGDLSPRARMIQLLGWIYPSRFGVPPPFDRHDWTVLRAIPGQPGQWKQIRYIIDFYEVPENDNDVDVASFNVDVRPALDSFGSVYDRIRNCLVPFVNEELEKS